MHMHACMETFARWKTDSFPLLLCIFGEQLPLSELPPSQPKSGLEGSDVGSGGAEERMESYTPASSVRVTDRADMQRRNSPAIFRLLHGLWLRMLSS